jgi:hypothetical protein
MMLLTVAAAVLAQSPTTFPSTETRSESPRSMITEIRLGSYYPWVDRPLTCGGTGEPACPYKSILGGAMLLVELEIERELFQAFGSASIGLTLGYGEKYGHSTTQTNDVGEATGLRVLPMKAIAAYRFDWLAIRYGIPLVPYVKLGFELAHWWVMKGGGTEVATDGTTGAGWTYGVVGAGGLAFQLDILDQRLARDFDNGLGVNHTYIFGEFNIAEVNNFGQKTDDGTTARALDLSSRFFMFGIAFEY